MQCLSCTVVTIIIPRTILDVSFHSPFGISCPRARGGQQDFSYFAKKNTIYEDEKYIQANNGLVIQKVWAVLVRATGLTINAVYQLVGGLPIAAGRRLDGHKDLKEFFRRSGLCVVSCVIMLVVGWWSARSGCAHARQTAEHAS